MRDIVTTSGTFTIEDDEELVRVKCTSCGHRGHIAIINLPGFPIASEAVKEMSCEKCGKNTIVKS